MKPLPWFQVSQRLVLVQSISNLESFFFLDGCWVILSLSELCCVFLLLFRPPAWPIDNLPKDGNQPDVLPQIIFGWLRVAFVSGTDNEVVFCEADVFGERGLYSMVWSVVVVSP